jgi:hypothetical protein
MPRPRHETDAALQALYDQIPDIPDCKGHCWMSCGPVEMSQRERQRIREAGVRITDGQVARAQIEEYWCEALGPDGRCAVYGLRPLICRAWGVAEGLRCPWGCRPEGGWMKDSEMRRLLLEAGEIGGEEAVDPSAIRRAARKPRDRTLGTVSAAGQFPGGHMGDARRTVVHGTELPEAVRKRKPPKVR